jgi:hypothetical protein
MKTWEEIIKERLKGREAHLPEGSLAEFRAKMDGAASSAPSHRRFPLVWTAAAAVAAGIAAIIFLHRPAAPSGNELVPAQPGNPVATVSGEIHVASDAEASVPDLPAVAPVPATNAVRVRTAPVRVEHASSETVQPEQLTAMAAEPGTDETAASSNKDVPVRHQEKLDPDSDVHQGAASPYIPEYTGGKAVKMKVSAAAGVVEGVGLLAALASGLYGVKNELPGLSQTAFGGYSGDVGSLPAGFIEASPTVGWLGDAQASHSFPLKVGLSIGIPVAERWRVTTGLDYSLYRSAFTYPDSGEKRQFAHYLGIPIRMDWILASNKWLDVYLGGGFEAEYCVRETLAGTRIDRNNYCLSLLGAGGIQWKFAGRAGLFLEPELSWTMPSNRVGPETYRSKKPFMFSISTGIRLNLGK